MAIGMEFFVSEVLHAELQKLMVTVKQSNEVLFVWLCYLKLQSYLVLWTSLLSHGEERVLSTEYITAVLPSWILQPDLMTVATLNTHLTSVKSIMLLTACHSGSVENCLLEVAIWTLEGKGGTTVRGRERKGCLRCSANWIDYYKMLSMQVNFRGQRTTWWYCPGCVTTHCYHERSGSLTWRAIGQYHLHGMTVAALHCS